MIPPKDIKKTTLKNYLNVLGKRIWVIVGFVIIIAGAVAFTELTTPPIYKTQTKIILQTIPTDKVIQETTFKDQVELIKSDKLAQKVIKELKLIPILTGESYPEEFEKAKKDIFSKVDIKANKNENTVAITAQGTDPERITKIANAWVGGFIKEDIAYRITEARRKKDFLEKQVAQALEGVEEAGKELDLFLQDNKIVTDPKAHEEVEKSIEDLREKKNQLEKEVIETLQTYREGHPQVEKLRTQIEQVQEQIKKESAQLRSIQEKILEYKLLRRNVDQKKATYESFLERLKEAALWEKPVTSNVKIVKHAQVPKNAVSPKPLKRIPKAIVLALILGIAVSFTIEYVDTTLRSQKDLKIYTGLPFLGGIPPAKKWIKDVNIELITQVKSSSKVAENFRSIKDAIVLSSIKERPIKSMVVSSAIPKEGKTVVASNLAIAFAQAKEETLIIDADMRNGNLNKGFDLKTKNGVSSVLAGICDVDKAITQSSIPHLSVMLPGPYAPNPIELINSKNFFDLMKEITQKFQRVIIDSPPLLTVADALLLSRACEGMIFVARANHTSLNHIIEVRKMLAKTKVIGTVLNCAKKPNHPKPL